MGSQWNVSRSSDGSDSSGEMFLLNRGRTLVKVGRYSSDDDVALLLSRMEELGVPVAYTDDLKEIRLTILRNTDDMNIEGDYLDGIVRLSCTRHAKPTMDRTLVHELGHHIDGIEGVSDREKIVEEWRATGSVLPDKYGKKSAEEYVAVGFELYYFSTGSERTSFIKNHKRLYNVVRSLHRKYSKRS